MVQILYTISFIKDFVVEILSKLVLEEVEIVLDGVTSMLPEEEEDLVLELALVIEDVVFAGGGLKATKKKQFVGIQMIANRVI